jgi:hypothetical protein
VVSYLGVRCFKGVVDFFMLLIFFKNNNKETKIILLEYTGTEQMKLKLTK